MASSEAYWPREPAPFQSNVRFCCPHCFAWVRHLEFENHLKIAHPDKSKATPTGKTQSPKR